MNVYVLRIGIEVIGVFNKIEDLYEVLNDFVEKDFNWSELKGSLISNYDFGNGFEEEVEVYSCLLK